MRLTKRQLKRIIKEEYSRLKRRGLIKEAAKWMYNEEMGPDGQDCPEGTSIEDCAKGWVEASISDYGPEILEDICDFVRPSSRGGGKDIMSMSNDDTDAGYALMDCLEGMSIDGSGNWNEADAAAALADVFCSGAMMDKYAVYESRVRRSRPLLREYVEQIRELIDQGMPKQKIFHKIKRQERDAGRYADFQEIYDVIDQIERGQM